ncbi:Linker histone H1 and H5 family protein [Aphelenchoides besseyi]|nr:Linker histone H1 and H5 family protein [Aphelenchoides besseyi]
MSVHVPPPHIRYLGPSTTDAASKKTTKSKSAPKAPKSKTTSSHPPYAVMIKKAIKTHGNAKGTSRAAILSYLLKNYTIGPNGTQINAKLRQALNRGITNGTLKQLKGNGANGSFGVVESKDAKPKTVKKSSKSKLPAKKTAAADKTKKSDEAQEDNRRRFTKSRCQTKNSNKAEGQEPEETENLNKIRSKEDDQQEESIAKEDENNQESAIKIRLIRFLLFFPL